MNKKILIVSSTLRKNGNSNILCDAFFKGAKESGHIVKKISLENKKINFCKGCLSCQKTKRCIIKDDANEILKEIFKSDVLVFATPIYFYEMAGQLKTLLDRTNPLFTTDYIFREVYLIATAAENKKSAVKGATNGLKCWVDCFENVKLTNVITGLGVTLASEIKEDSESFKKAYLAGKNI